MFSIFASLNGLDFFWSNLVPAIATLTAVWLLVGFIAQSFTASTVAVRCRQAQVDAIAFMTVAELKAFAKVHNIKLPKGRKALMANHLIHALA